MTSGNQTTKIRLPTCHFRILHIYSALRYPNIRRKCFKAGAFDV